MKYLLDSAAMKKIDEYSIKTTGIPSVVLMERAALSVSSFVEKHLRCLYKRKQWS